MDESLKAAASVIQQRHSAEVQEFRGELTLVVSSQKIAAVLQALRDEFGFDRLIDVTAVDYWPEEKPRFHVVYHLYSMLTYQVICVRSPLDGNAPSIATAEKIWPNANWYEREVWDLFGIRFEGHSDLRRIIMPYEWEGHPLRKDYPLGYEEVQFTFNQDEIMVKKPHPEDRS